MTSHEYQSSVSGHTLDTHLVPSLCHNFKIILKICILSIISHGLLIEHYVVIGMYYCHIDMKAPK